MQECGGDLGYVWGWGMLLRESGTKENALRLLKFENRGIS